jgi:hypothetical protein
MNNAFLSFLLTLGFSAVPGISDALQTTFPNVPAWFLIFSTVYVLAFAGNKIYTKFNG